MKTALRKEGLEYQSPGKSIPLLKQVISSQGSQKLYPLYIYPSLSLISSLQAIFSCPGLLDLCEKWRKQISTSVLECVRWPILERFSCLSEYPIFSGQT